MMRFAVKTQFYSLRCGEIRGFQPLRTFFLSDDWYSWDHANLAGQYEELKHSPHTLQLIAEIDEAQMAGGAVYTALFSVCLLCSHSFIIPLPSFQPPPPKKTRTPWQRRWTLCKRGKKDAWHFVMSEKRKSAADWSLFGGWTCYQMTTHWIIDNLPWFYRSTN